MLLHFGMENIKFIADVCYYRKKFKRLEQLKGSEGQHVIMPTEY